MSENIQVPNGWEVKKLGEVFDIQMCKRIYKEQTNYESGIPFYKIGTIGKAADAFIDEQLYNIYKNKYNYPLTGETLITCSGTIGKCYQYNGEEAYFQDSNIVWLRAKNHNKINLNYIFIVISNIRWNSVEKTTITRLYTPTLKKAKILLPPLEEQKKISEILMLWDKAIEQTKELITYKEKQKKGLMQLLLTGKKRLDGFTDEWKTVKLGEIFDYQNGNSNEEYIEDDGKYFLITLNSIDIKGRLKKYHKQINQGQPLLCKNDIIIILSDIAHGSFLGLSTVIEKDNKYILNQRVGLLRPKTKINSYFISYVINLNQGYFKKHGQGSSQLNLSKGDIMNFTMHIPLNIIEQNLIVDILSKADKEIELLNKQLELYTEQKKGLMQNLLTGKIRV